MTEAEYLERFAAAYRMSGAGFETTMHVPCPFCAAPDNITYKVLEVAAALSDGATCEECGRSWRAIATLQGGNVRFEVVQTGGDDGPDFLPRMRRVVLDTEKG